jgi:hypothetical protein
MIKALLLIASLLERIAKALERISDGPIVVKSQSEKRRG